MAKRLLVIAVLSAAVTVAGCTYDPTEPGLFRSQAPRPSPSLTSREPEPPVPKPNPSLPVAGEHFWTTADGSGVRLRIAVHAVRRIAGATVLDWSVTPEAAPGLRLGEALTRSVDFGLTGESGNSVKVELVEGGRVYRPLTHTSAQAFHHCLCTPIWLAEQSLRVGVTTLMQVAYPPMPEPTGFVDVLFATVPSIFHVALTPIGQVPTAGRPRDVRHPVRPDSLGASVRFRYPGGPERQQLITVDRIITGPAATSMSWTIQTLNDQRNLRLAPFGPPVNRIPAGPGVVNANATDGPTLRPGGRGPKLAASWMTADIYGRAGFECLCTELGLWSAALWSPGGAVSVVTNYPALPAGTRQVDVSLPGVGVLKGLPVEPAPDAAAAVGRSRPAPLDVWTDNPAVPRPAWTGADWPTPLPAAAQLRDYVFTVEQVTTTPRL